MVSLSLKPQTNETQTSESPSNGFAHWVDVETTWIEGKTGCPYCGKSLRVACDKEIATLHIQKDEDAV